MIAPRSSQAWPEWAERALNTWTGSSKNNYKQPPVVGGESGRKAPAFFPQGGIPRLLDPGGKPLAVNTKACSLSTVLRLVAVVCSTQGVEHLAVLSRRRSEVSRWGLEVYENSGVKFILWTTLGHGCNLFQILLLSSSGSITDQFINKSTLSCILGINDEAM